MVSNSKLPLLGIDIHTLALRRLAHELDAAVDTDALADLLLAKDGRGLLGGDDGGVLELLDLLGREPLLLGEAALLAAAHAGQQVGVGLDELLVGGEVLGALAGEAALGEDALALRADLRHAVHGLERLGHEVAVVPDRHVAPRRELQRAVHRHLLAGRLAEGFRPLQLARVALHDEVLVALGAAEAELFGIVAAEGLF